MESEIIELKENLNNEANENNLLTTTKRKLETDIQVYCTF